MMGAYRKIRVKTGGMLTERGRIPNYNTVANTLRMNNLVILGNPAPDVAGNAQCLWDRNDIVINIRIDEGQIEVWDKGSKCYIF